MNRFGTCSFYNCFISKYYFSLFKKEMGILNILYELKNIKHYYKEKKVLDIEHLELEQNQIIGFFGPNGSGKSTLFSILSFISKPREGEVLIKNQNNLDFEIKKDIVFL